jgi:prevent-host-death family protein
MVHIHAMRVSVTAAKAQLTDLVRRAEAGEEVVLTRHGQPAARIVAERATKPFDPEERLRILEAFSRAASAKITPGPCAARSQDFLYDDETGLPK